MASPRKARKTSSVCREGQEEEEVTTLEEAKQVIRELRDKSRTQSQQLLAWRRRLRLQDEERERADAARAAHLSHLSSQLLLLEARLLRKRRDIDSLLGQRDATISRQSRALSLLQARLVDAGLDAGLDLDLDADSPLDSLNDSDSAVVLEDDSVPSRSGSRGSSRCISVSRSVSDAVEPGGKHGGRRSNGFLRRPEVLETVYSVEEDADSDAPPTAASDPALSGGDGLDAPPTASSAPALCGGSIDTPPSATSTPAGRPPSAKRLSWTSTRTPALCGSMERADIPPAGPLCDQLARGERAGGSPPHVNTYNRVMSNHRSVTKPKDVKYKRINKAKSKSLEELRGRLKNWVDKGHRSVLAFEHSEA